jgi:2Fe-2S ferredoxin
MPGSIAPGAATDNESAMLDIVTAPRLATSRLSCQITASAALDGLVVHVPGQ